MSFAERHKSGGGTCSANRRKSRRLVVQLDIVVRLMGSSGQVVATETATTCNVSPTDMYFESMLGEMHPGQIVDVDIDPPIRSSVIFSERHLAARGRIVRVGPASVQEPNRRGVAVVFLEPPAFQTALE